MQRTKNIEEPENRSKGPAATESFPTTIKSNNQLKRKVSEVKVYSILRALRSLSRSMAVASVCWTFFRPVAFCSSRASPSSSVSSTVVAGNLLKAWNSELDCVSFLILPDFRQFLLVRTKDSGLGNEAAGKSRTGMAVAHLRPNFLGRFACNSIFFPPFFREGPFNIFVCLGSWDNRRARTERGWLVLTIGLIFTIF